MGLDITIDELARLGVHGYGARHVNEATGLDGLAVDARERLRGVGGKDRGLLGCRHGCWKLRKYPRYGRRYYDG